MHNSPLKYLLKSSISHQIPLKKVFKHEPNKSWGHLCLKLKSLGVIHTGVHIGVNIIKFDKKQDYSISQGRKYNSCTKYNY